MHPVKRPVMDNGNAFRVVSRDAERSKHGARNVVGTRACRIGHGRAGDVAEIGLPGLCS
jgi:hypothetical protein